MSWVGNWSEISLGLGSWKGAAPSLPSPPARRSGACCIDSIPMKSGAAKLSVSRVDPWVWVGSIMGSKFLLSVSLVGSWVHEFTWQLVGLGQLIIWLVWLDWVDENRPTVNSV